MSVFLFTDIEGSTQKWEKFPLEMKTILARHDEIINKNIDEYGGRVIKHTGDGIFATFEGGHPLKCAIEIQKAIAQANWDPLSTLRIRIGIHTGYAEKRGEDFFGTVINRTARIMAVAWGGQIILSAEMANSMPLPEGATLRDLGEHMLKDLGEPQRLYQLHHPDLSLVDFPALNSLSVRPHNLPIQTTPFLGRDDELKEVVQTLKEPSCRLLTITGPGGTGKTRLAIQAAAEASDVFQDGVYFISLAPLSSPDSLVSTIASAVHFTFYSQGDEKNQLLDYFRNKNILLVMDNFEHLAHGAQIIIDILEKTEKIKILVTSRELMNLQGEWVVQLSGLQIPDKEKVNIEGYSAVQLFFYNAQRVNANASISAEDKQYVVRICQLVGGLPLGIELASAWLKALSCKEIAQEIEKNYDFLETSMRNVPERHRSLRAVFDYSWTLLAEKEKTALMKLSLFQGGFSRYAAEKVAEAPLPVISSLIDKSLLRKNKAGRFNMLEMIQQYAKEKLQSQPELEAKATEFYCSFFSDYLKQQEFSITGPKQQETLYEIHQEIENIRAMWYLALDRGYTNATDRAMNCLYHFYESNSWLKEGFEIYAAASEKLRSKDKKIHARALVRKGYFASKVLNLPQALDILEASLKVFKELGAEDEIADNLDEIGSIHYLLGEYEKAKNTHGESLAIYRRLNNRYGTANALNRLGSVFEAMGDYSGAQGLHQQSMIIYKEIGLQRGVSACLNHLGNIAESQGKFKEARQFYEESIAISNETDDQWGIARSYNNLANVHASIGEFAKAKQMYEESLAVFKILGTPRGIASALTNIGIILRKLGDFKAAIEKHEEALSICQNIEYPMGIAASLSNLGSVALESGNLADAKKCYEESLDICQKIDNKWFIAVILENLADIATRSNNLKEAQHHLQEALKMAYSMKAFNLLTAIIVGFAELLERKSKFEKAAQLLLVAMNSKTITSDIMLKADTIMERLSAVIAPNTLQVLRKTAQHSRLEDTVQKLLAGLPELS